MGPILRLSFLCVVSLVMAMTSARAAFTADQPGSAAGADVDASPFEIAVAEAKSNMMKAPQAALEAAQRAEAHAAATDGPNALATSLWLQGEALTRLNRAGEAVPIITRARDSLGETRTKLAGDVLVALGRAERNLSLYGGALASFQEAYRIYDELGVRRSSALALQSIGTLYDSARQYDRVIEYYERASAAFSDGAMLDLVSLNNRANAYREIGRYDEAAEMQKQALAMARKSGGSLLPARILTNIAVLETKRGDLPAAEAAIQEAFALSDNEDAKGWTPFIWGAKAQIEAAKGDNEAASSAIEKAFEGADLGATPPPFRDFHEAALNIYEALGETKTALAHAAAFKRLDDEGRDIAASANLALMNAEFEVANKELQIERLRSGQLERDIALAEARSRQIRIVGVSGAALGCCLIGFLFYAALSARRRDKATQAFNETLAAKNEELTHTIYALEKANQAKLAFLATTSHEIRTPLNAIIGLSDIVLNGGAVIDRDREYLKSVNESGHHLLSIVSDILDISKMEAGRLVVDKRPTDVAAAIDAVAGIWRKAADEKRLALRVEFDESPMGFVTDGRLIRQLASNLLSNAVKFTKTGSIDVRLEKSLEAGFILTVSDTGVGIPDASQDQVFEPFRQADARLSREFGGAGLGLAICRRIAEALGGSISVRSTEGEGATFIVAIPAEPALVAQEEIEAPAEVSVPDSENKSGRTPVADRLSAAVRHPTVDLSRLRVLMAEDNLANAMVAKAMLKDVVGDIEVVENGALAVEAVQSGEFDLVLMDKQMPVKDGVAATKEIRALDTRVNSIPIIAVTADVFEGAREDMLQCGMNDFVSKPITKDAIVGAIAKVLGPAGGPARQAS
ncbi:MAG: ATP-binding protein [Pseudomonadota bacterium]